jgi:hypothetical protein
VAAEVGEEATSIFFLRTLATSGSSSIFTVRVVEQWQATRFDGRQGVIRLASVAGRGCLSNGRRGWAAGFVGLPRRGWVGCLVCRA